MVKSGEKQQNVIQLSLHHNTTPVLNGPAKVYTPKGFHHQMFSLEGEPLVLNLFSTHLRLLSSRSPDLQHDFEYCLVSASGARSLINGFIYPVLFLTHPFRVEAGLGLQTRTWTGITEPRPLSAISSKDDPVSSPKTGPGRIRTRQKLDGGQTTVEV